MKRLLSCTSSEMLKMDGQELKQAILASEGRTVMTETVVAIEPLLGDLTNAELAVSFGSDMVLLNCFIVTTQHTRLLSWCPDSDCAKAVQRNELFARYTSASSFFSPVGMIFERFILLNASLNNRLIVWLSRKRKVYL